MIEYLEIKNFKSIKSKYFPLRNLNVLLGLNGQGKSSFIQALLAIRQSNIESSRVKGWLSLKGRYCNIGTSKDALYQYAKDKTIEFNLGFNSKTDVALHYDYEIEENALSPKLEVEKVIQEIVKNNEALFVDSFQYLNAFRIEPKSIFPKDNYEVVRKKNIGNHGEYAAHFLETYHDSEVKFENVLHSASFVKDSLMQRTIVNKTLINQVNLWLGEISPGVNVRTTTINQDEVLLEYVFDQPNYGNTNRFKPENVGFGITYALPVVTALLAAQPGGLLIIENPESHIHPRGQAELGKLIALVAQNDVQIIIETHSDHILNGIRVGVKEEKLDKEKVILFYFQKVVEEQEQYSSVINIEIDKNGTLSDYPENLLDEWSNQLSKLL